MSRRRVVVTGMGMVTPLGNNVKDTWDNILEGKSGVSEITSFDASQFSTRFAAQVNNFDATQYMSVKEARKMDLFIQYGIAAAVQALDDANLNADTADLSRVGCAIGSGIGGLPMIEKNLELLNESGPKRISPFFVPGAIINMISGHVAIRFGFKGPNISIVTACTTGTHNIGMAGRMIAYGDADVMIAGGAEMAITPLGIGGFGAARALSTRNDDHKTASRPWDKNRDGFVMGDGAGILILEEYEHAVARGATIYAELAGFGMSDDAYHMTAPPENGEGAVLAMNAALKDAHLTALDVDYINAHGTSTPAGDLAETQAVKTLMGDDASDVAISSTKSMIGHLLGASGAVESIFSILAIRDQVAPPTINLEEPSEGCDLNYVSGTPQKRKIDVVLNNSFGFGGTNGTLVFKKVS
ncbi:beta-ketoacyl-ACP synthase II [Marinomonas foliarum]|jgi:3-oxoacyl-[acyl-carrier-protein] synthase II|uniref:3-oxoacyl-[acyl-carrier-protein] synthase 2 n=1 Tax=Marinomonas foliarum TaxID=491950 RepID=A0A368ZZU5_9GAMM|nr:beta-ketoacyl-ACP synthase II [Marinomonas foliarum]QRV23984.1 beta-ketoacyl-ACP synthase II [Marinomonas foliarum]RCX02453.1 3-oxoacyl-[acyl-carrier-protein] synthase II [Marinomonas foliarum]